ncbi:hypothetical protein GmHk_18G051901 [Glycine max]|nr:hypothetical protein GmHk_18G051901 [Glycine max]
MVLSRASPLVALLEFPNVRKKEKGLKSPLHDPTCDASCSIHRHYFANPNGADVRKLISNHIPKFHDNPTVNEFGIIVLRRQLWVSTEKKKLQCEGYFSQIRHVFIIPNGENVRE